MSKTFNKEFPDLEQWDIPEWQAVVGEEIPSYDSSLCCAARDPEVGFLCVLPMNHDCIYHVAAGGDSLEEITSK